MKKQPNIFKALWKAVRKRNCLYIYPEVRAFKCRGYVLHLRIQFEGNAYRSYDLR